MLRNDRYLVYEMFLTRLKRFISRYTRDTVVLIEQSKFSKGVFFFLVIIILITAVYIGICTRLLHFDYTFKWHCTEFVKSYFFEKKYNSYQRKKCFTVGARIIRYYYMKIKYVNAFLIISYCNCELIKILFGVLPIIRPMNRIFKKYRYYTYRDKSEFIFSNKILHNLIWSSDNEKKKNVWQIVNFYTCLHQNALNKKRVIKLTIYLLYYYVS